MGEVVIKGRIIEGRSTELALLIQVLAVVKNHVAVKLRKPREVFFPRSHVLDYTEDYERNEIIDVEITEWIAEREKLL